MTVANGQTETTRGFVLWLLAQLSLEPTVSDGVFRVEVPEELRDALEHRRELHFSFDPEAARPQEGQSVELVSAESHLLDLLVHAARETISMLHSRPCGDARGVHEITGPLFAAYTVDGGHVYLGGCQFEDHPALRMTCRIAGRRADDPDSTRRLCHLTVGPNGQVIDEQTAARLGFHDLTAIGESPPRITEHEAAKLQDTATQEAQARFAAVDDSPCEPLLSTMVWRRFAHGRLRFSIGESSAELPFSGWASELQPPPFVCPHTGAESFRLAATDDGRITVAEQLDECQQSGRRMLRSDLVECSVTGRRVLTEYVETCPVTGEKVLRDALVACRACRQEVHPGAVRRGVCRACRSMASVSKTEARVARLLGEYPGLDRWRRWKIAESSTVYIVEASSWLERLRIVLDKHSFAPLLLATAGRLWSDWTPVEPDRYDEWLRG